ncbi:choice-of-anchor R domain-containing protein [Microcystis aeruginosa]|uniref:choice-of-anchor R domain-containing protein n=1 Tax=Microcystis aeruginosa TaxID=1126 RepID=UPI00232DE027|nr:choice-of-anchor R domain-containing protein [Microcystis aeruginosa]MDB9414184.1 PEP-CTERM sorting domain-containing protein [Microcystis aeruginosa CS-567/02]
MTKNQQILAKMGGSSLALLLSLSLGQQASAATLVENLSQPPDMGFQVKNNQWLSSSFQTGNASYDYTLNSVTLRFGQFTPGSLFVKLYSNLAGNPGSEITSFNVPSIGGTNTYDFTLTNPYLLTANTTYWLVAGISSGSGEYFWGKTNSTAEIGLPGWSIGNLAFFSDGVNNVWNAFPALEPFQFSVNGTENPPHTNIPEPGSVIALLGLGGLGLASRLKKLSTRA